MSLPSTPEQRAAGNVWQRDTPYPATLVEQRRLTAPGSVKDVRHFEIDLGTSGMAYEPGDSLAIWVRNDPLLVAAIIAQCGLNPAQIVQVDETRECMLETALQRHVEVTQVHPGFIKHYAEYCTAPALLALASDTRALREYLANRQIIDVLRQFPARLTGPQLLGCLRQMNPRQYSIASSPLVQPTRIALTVNMVSYEQGNELRTGAASSFLGWHVHAGEQLPVFVMPNPNFRLPEDGTHDIVMIGPGTGIAPFRAFLQQRVASGASGRNWLFFGNPTQAGDYLYQDELEAWHRDGVLQHLDLAFSRDQAQKVYVQHRMRERARELFAWFEGGASVYVCGDARHMAEDVQKTLLDIISQEGNLDPAAARQYLVKMRQEKRYQRDVY